MPTQAWDMAPGGRGASGCLAYVLVPNDPVPEP